MPKSTLYGNYLVTKRNVLNDLRPKDATLQELRFFTVYLSKINPSDEGTRLVRFSLEDFRDIMGINSRITASHLQDAVDGLLTKIVGMPDDKGTGIVRFQLFKKCRISEDGDGEWYVEIDAHDDALPLMFGFQSHYFKYELWNALRLKSRNQLWMYEILKQYENIGWRVIAISNLKTMLGIEVTSYASYKDFREKVIDVCQKALSQHTDISFTYEPHGKKGRGGKINELKFTITKNRDFVSPLGLEKFINLRQVITDAKNNSTEYYENDKYNIDKISPPQPRGTSSIYEERILFLQDACSGEFNREEMVVLFDIMSRVVPHLHTNDLKSFAYLQQKYRELDMMSKRSNIQSRFGYMRKLVSAGES